jgi:hypothetical protein
MRKGAEKPALVRGAAENGLQATVHFIRRNDYDWSRLAHFETLSRIKAGKPNLKPFHQERRATATLRNPIRLAFLGRQRIL